MALQDTAIKLMELDDVAIAQLLTDSTTAPTYSTSVNLNGSTKLQVSPKTETKKLHGDSQLLDVYQRTTEVEINVEFALLSLQALKVMMGGSYTSTGVTPDQTTTYSLKGTDTAPPYFKLEGRWTYAGEGIGDAHVVLYKCKATDLPDIEINDANGNFGTVKMKGIALPCVSNSSWFDIVLNETRTAIV